MQMLVACTVKVTAVKHPLDMSPTECLFLGDPPKWWFLLWFPFKATKQRGYPHKKIHLFFAKMKFRLRRADGRRLPSFVLLPRSILGVPISSRRFHRDRAQLLSQESLDPETFNLDVDIRKPKKKKTLGRCSVRGVAGVPLFGPCSGDTPLFSVAQSRPFSPVGLVAVMAPKG